MIKINKEYKRAAVIIAVVLIPLIYSFFFLYAFWDPYSKLSDLPVVVVNEDKGAEINGSFKNAGNEIIDEIKGDNSLKWVVTSKHAAEEGLRERKYYAEVYIPDDFSQKLSTADKSEKVEGVLIYRPNEKRNFLAAQVLNRGMLELKNKISRKLTKEIVGNIVVEVKKVPDNLKTMDEKLVDAKDGAGQLSDGLGELMEKQGQYNDGVKKLKSGLYTLKNGSKQLAGGEKLFSQKVSAGLPQINKLSAGSDEFDKNLTKFNEAAAALNTGAQGINGGARKLSSGLSALYTALSTPNSGLSDFANGAQNFGKGLQQFISGFSAINDGSVKASQGMTEYSQKIKAYNDGLNQYFTGVKTLAATDKSIADYMTSYVKAHPEAMTDKNIQGIMSIYQKSQGSIEKLATATEELKAGGNALVDGAGKLQEANKQISDGMTQITDKSKELITGAGQLSTGAGTVGTSMGQIVTSVKQLSDGADKLNTASSQLVKGTTALAGGAGKLASGYKQINNGLQLTAEQMEAVAAASGELYKGSEKLNNGLSSAYDGVNTLAGKGSQFIEGEQKIKDGAETLENGLADGRSELSEKIKDAEESTKKLDGIDQYASEPVQMKDEKLNPVPDYGTAFTPYFISLSLWVGALIMFIIIFLNPDYKFKSMFRKNSSLIDFVAYPVLGIIQALALSLVIKNGLGLHVKSASGFYLTCILISLAFVSIEQFLIVSLNDVGKFVIILLLILQLTSCGGTFPMELVPKFFNGLYRFMPMTYSINSLREVIAGIDHKFLGENEIVLASIMVVFSAASFFITKYKDEKALNEEKMKSGKITEGYSL